MRFLVCGGRDYVNRQAVYDALDLLNNEVGVTAIISGMARGADTHGAQWAQDRGVELVKFPADWNKHGKGAGPIRNQQMLNEGKPDGVVAFPGRNGTADMIYRSKMAGLEVWEPEDERHTKPHTANRRPAVQR